MKKQVLKNGNDNAHYGLTRSGYGLYTSPADIERIFNAKSGDVGAFTTKVAAQRGVKHVTTGK